MAQNTRQTNLLVQQDWTKVYQSFTNADFTSYDFETLRNSMINYLKTYYPESFNDFLESSEYLALIDMIAFLGQSLSFRTDLNARENFLDTAQRRDSILKLARMLSYNPQRTTSASGLLKIDSISTTESIVDSSGINLTNTVIHWNDVSNDNWLEQFNSVLNASLVSSQTVGKSGNSQLINNIQTDEYSISLNPNSLPIGAFRVPIQEQSVAFEAVSATTVGENYIYEADPTVAGAFNILYRNDNNGNGSNNTGFFMFFKQGALNSTDISITNAIPNNYAPINTNNINNNDFWLYALDVSNAPTTKWAAVPALPGVNVIYNQSTAKNIYQINTRTNDQIDLVFGDGTFANIPQGNFRFFYRTSNGANYSITPDDMSSVTVAFNYINKRGTSETLTVTASLKYTVINATAAQSLDSIKSSAPQQYYTQNRMITGEDYNIFPQTSFTSIQKVKVINRTSSGVSLYLDALDPTGSYSSTNIIGDDGILSSNTTVSSKTFDFLTTNDIYSTIYNNVIPLISSTDMVNYYYATYPRLLSPNVGNIVVQNSSIGTSGNLTNSNASPVIQQVGPGIAGNLQYVDVGASLKFTAPTGYHFNAQNELVVNANIASGDTDVLYAAVISTVVNDDAYTPSMVNFGTAVPNSAILNSIIPPYKNSLPSELIAILISQIRAQVNFGITYDQLNQIWVNILPADISADDSWLVKFTYNQGLYTVNNRSLKYSFASAGNTKFYFDPTSKVYNSATATNIPDTIKVLKTNTQPGTPPQSPLVNDVVWQIYNTMVEPDGYVDNTQVLVKFPMSQMENVPDNPDLYTTVAASSTSRPDLYFQYKHNVPSRGRIDPTPVNIMDMYILAADYASSYSAWLKDLTNTIVEPTPPTSSSLEIAYSTLNEYKTVSDSIVYNPAKFKPLFGVKADPSLQARFQVIKNPSMMITDNEIKSQLIAAINTYFDISNWDFGETFYFSELAAYLHTTLVPNIASIIIVPVDTTLVFGNYFQINSDPWEIITSAATVNDVDVVTAVTAAQLNLGNPLVGTF